MTNQTKIHFILILLFSLAFNFSNAQSTVYISNSGNNYNVLEGETYSFTLNLYNTVATPVIVDVTLLPQGDTDASDFTPLTTTVTIPAGQLSTTTPLDLITTNDAIIESNEYVLIKAVVTSGNTNNEQTSRVIHIIDNDTPPEITTYQEITITEGYNRIYYYNLSNPYNTDIVMNVDANPGSADASDFTPISSTITFLAGQTSASQIIITTNDALVEPNETFTITGTVVSGNTNNTTVTTNVTIKDNDVAPTVTISGYDRKENLNINFSVRLDRVYSQDVTIQLVTSNGTATTSDYVYTNITETIPAGSTYKSVTVQIIDDNLDEPEESFTLTGTVLSGNTVNSSVSTSVNIIDNDGLPDINISSSNNSLNIEEGEDKRYYVSLSHSSPVDTHIQLTSTDGSAGNLDYTPINNSIIIPAGSTSYFDVILNATTLIDQLEETDETFNIIATVTTGNTYNTSKSLTYTIKDNYNVNAYRDSFLPIAEVGGSFNVLTNDLLHGLPVNATDVTIELESNSYGLTLDNNGVLTVPSSLPIGYYNIDYTLCEIANPSFCDTVNININVSSPLEVVYVPTYSDYNGDGYTSAGDIITYQFNVTNNGNQALTNIEPDGFPYGIVLNLTGSVINSLDPGETDSTTFSAIHIITQQDINSGYFNGELVEYFFTGMYYNYEVSTYVVGEPLDISFSNGIKLKAFVDTNVNGVQDTNEINFPLGYFEYEINNDAVIHNLYTTPYYLYESNPTTTYNLNYVVNSEYAAYNICNVNYTNITVDQNSGITTYNFPVTVTPYTDLSVSLNNYNQLPVPGFTYRNYVAYTNNSNQTITPGTINFELDNALSIIDVQEGAVITSTGFTYAFSDLEPYQTKYVWVKMQVPTLPTVNLGQTVNNSVSINIPTGDIYPINNTSTLSQIIVGAYDPNIKKENHGGQIVHSAFTPNDFLTYTIQFENTGTANAINVRVEDFLDSKLDETTIRMIDASATYALERIDNHLIWNFFGIDLPPSEEGTEVGHGYFTFKIKPKAGYQIGDIIPNEAEIYFDFNPAIVTEVCNTEFVTSLLSVEDFEFNTISFYPNPVENNLTILNTTLIETIEVTSLLGKNIMTKEINSLQTEVNLSTLSKGVYFIKVKTSEGEKTIKILKN